MTQKIKNQSVKALAAIASVDITTLENMLKDEKANFHLIPKELIKVLTGIANYFNANGESPARGPAALVIYLTSGAVLQVWDSEEDEYLAAHLGNVAQAPVQKPVAGTDITMTVGKDPLHDDYGYTKGSFGDLDVKLVDGHEVESLITYKDDGNVELDFGGDRPYITVELHIAGHDYVMTAQGATYVVHDPHAIADIKAANGTDVDIHITGVGTAPVITSDPSNLSLEVGSTGGSFTVTATGATTYQWQVRDEKNHDLWHNVAGKTSATLSFPAQTDDSKDGTHYRCMVGSADGSIPSGDARLSVSSPLTGIALVADKSDPYKVGESGRFIDYKLTPSRASLENEVWSSSDETVATVLNGDVVLIKAGTTTIKLVSGTVTGTFLLTVAPLATATKAMLVAKNTDGTGAYLAGAKGDSDATTLGTFPVIDGDFHGIDYTLTGIVANATLSKVSVYITSSAPADRALGSLVIHVGSHEVALQGAATVPTDGATRYTLLVTDKAAADAIVAATDGDSFDITITEA